MSKTDPAATPALTVLKTRGVDFTLHSYTVEVEADTYGEAVARTLGVSPDRLFKTLLAEVDGRAVVAIVPVSGRLSLKGLARAVGGKKATLMAPADAERITGYVVGGISPFGQKRPSPTFVDDTMELFETVFVSAGRRGLQIEIRPRDLITLTAATTAGLTE